MDNISEFLIERLNYREKAFEKIDYLIELKLWQMAVRLNEE